MSYKGTGIFITERVPATKIYQNHLDVLHSQLEDFCSQNKNYSWGILAKGGKTIGIDVVESYLTKTQPDKITYKILNDTRDNSLIVRVDNGITLSLKNGTYELLGLLHLITEKIGLVKTPSIVVFMRRYWAVNLAMALLVIPTTWLYLTRHMYWAIAWVIVFIIGSVMLFMTLLESHPEFFEDEFLKEKVILKTRICYNSFSPSAGYPLNALFTSTETLVSFFASLATIASFLLLLMKP